VFASLLKDCLSLFEVYEITNIGSLLEFLRVKSFVELGLADNFPHDVSLDDIFQAVTQASFDVLATH
jgi:hypothetical protein